MAIDEISVKELTTLVENGSLVIDVREPDEYESGHIRGAILVPLSTVLSNTSEFESDETVYVVCRSGGRSMQACEMLHDVGISNVVNVAGGTMGWISLGNEIVTGEHPS
ncbi:MAG: rhodanese-like domain-containing protein [Actinobacteria bacterium]|nr:rhodanese-like domain-containing protein [Actinomycetota bacterium]